MTLKTLIKIRMQFSQLGYPQYVILTKCSMDIRHCPQRFAVYQVSMFSIVLGMTFEGNQIFRVNFILGSIVKLTKTFYLSIRARSAIICIIFLSVSMILTSGSTSPTFNRSTTMRVVKQSHDEMQIQHTHKIIIKINIASTQEM